MLQQRRSKSCWSNGNNRTWAIFFVYQFVMLIHSIMLAMGESRSACATHQPLYDVVHTMRRYPNMIITMLDYINPDHVIAGLTVVVVVMFYFHKQRGLIFRRFCVFHSFMSLSRAILIWFTTIPSPNSMCRGRHVEQGWNRVFKRAFALNFPFLVDTFQLPTGITCCDIIVSGHTCVLMVDTLLLYYTLSNKSIKVAAWVACIVAAFANMTKDRHYAIDVFIAMYLGILFIGSYHINLQQRRSQSTSSLLHWIEQPQIYPDDSENERVDLFESIQDEIKRLRAYFDSRPTSHKYITIVTLVIISILFIRTMLSYLVLIN